MEATGGVQPHPPVALYEPSISNLLHIQGKRQCHYIPWQPVHQCSSLPRQASTLVSGKEEKSSKTCVCVARSMGPAARCLHAACLHGYDNMTLKWPSLIGSMHASHMEASVQAVRDACSSRCDHCLPSTQAQQALVLPGLRKGTSTKHMLADLP